MTLLNQCQDLMLKNRSSSFRFEAPGMKWKQLADGAEKGRVQMLARLGYANDAGPAPRWPLASRIVG